MVPVVCVRCRHVFDVPETRLKLVCPECGVRMSKKEPSLTVEKLMTGPLLNTVNAGVTKVSGALPPARGPVKPAGPDNPSAPEPGKAGESA